MPKRLPHPFLLLLGAVVLAAGLTWVLPAGEYQRQLDAAGRSVVIPGTYTAVEAHPTGLMALLLAVPRGIVAGADVIVTILFAGGAFALLDATGALGRLVGRLLGVTRHPRAMIVFVSLLFATAGALEAMGEEIIAMVPVLVVLSRGLGFGAITAVSMSMGASWVGAAFGPTNPFGTGIALRFAELDPLTSVGTRLVLLAVALALWISWTVARSAQDDVRPDIDVAVVAAPTTRDYFALLCCVLPIAVYVYGVLTLDWGFNELSALFLVGGVAAGLAQGWALEKTIVEFLKAMETMLVAGLFVGVARAISVVLTDGRVIDTIVAGLVAPLETLPAGVAAVLMVPMHALIHIPVSSTSGQAVLTMPIMAPTADLLGISRDAAVMAYQGGGIAWDIVNPTNGTLLAILLRAGVPYGRWVRFAIPGVLLLFAVSAAGVLILR